MTPPAPCALKHGRQAPSAVFFGRRVTVPVSLPADLAGSTFCWPWYPP